MLKLIFCRTLTSIIMKLIPGLLIALFLGTCLSAQDKNNARFNKISPEDFALPGSPGRCTTIRNWFMI